VGPDGAVRAGALEAATDPGIVCFAVYPTLDLRLGAGLHHDVDDVDEPATWARTQAGALRQVCDLYVPVYRQVLVGTYVGRDTDKKEQCFDAAYADVLAAFEEVLRREPDAGLVLYGHSQGGQHLSRLIRERIETDPDLLARLIAAYPIGWALGTDVGEPVGGSFEVVPSCAAADQTGCAVGYRSFLAGNDLPDTGRFFEGAQGVCVNPASPGAPGAKARLAAFTIAADHALVRDPPPGIPAGALLRYEDAFEAQCTGTGQQIALRARWVRPDEPPVDLDTRTVTAVNGAHILDLNLGLEDLVDDIARRTAD
jgi:hypothetical protein